MQSRRDQVDAQSHLISRLTCAMVRAEPDALEPPTRRDTRALAGGLLLAVLALLGVAGWAFFSKSGSTAWEQPGALILDKTNGSRYMLMNGRLRPVLNLASARLLSKGSLNVVQVPATRLAKVPRGEPIGVPAAPDSLPAVAALNRGTWSVCATATPRTTTTPATAAAGPGLLVDVGSPPSADRLDDDEAILVAADGAEYLLWHGQRLKLASDWVADVLGFGSVPPLTVDPRWIKLVPAGPDLAPPAVAGVGEPGPELDGRETKVGALYGIPSAGAHFVMTGKGLAALNETQYALAAADPATVPEDVLDPAVVARAPRTALPKAQLPVTAPTVRPPGPDTLPCLEFSPSEPALGVQITRRPAVSGAVRTGSDGKPVTVQVTPQGGALVVTRPDVAAKDQPAVLVDDAGTAYPLAGNAVTALGYSTDNAVLVPATWLALLPPGPLLDQNEGG